MKRTKKNKKQGAVKNNTYLKWGNIITYPSLLFKGEVPNKNPKYM